MRFWSTSRVCFIALCENIRKREHLLLRRGLHRLLARHHAGERDAVQRRGLSALRPGSGLHERVRAELQIRGEGTRHRDGERQLRRTLLPFGAGTVAVAGLVGNSRARAVCELDESGHAEPLRHDHRQPGDLRRP